MQEESDLEKSTLETLPPILQPAEGRHEDVAQRIEAVKEAIQQRNVFVPPELEDNKHFWFRVMEQYQSIRSSLSEEASIAGVNLPMEFRRRVASRLAIEQAAKLIKMEGLRFKDGLTGAWNRAALDNRLELLRKRYIRKINDGKRPEKIAVVLLDIDDFKTFNDRHGHNAGDKLLRELVVNLQENTRIVQDMVGRYGGEEFAIIMAFLEEIDDEQVFQRVENLRKVIAQTTKITYAGKQLSATASFGVTIVRPDDKTTEAIYQRADDALYKVKQAGKNRTFSDKGKVITD